MAVLRQFKLDECLRVSKKDPTPPSFGGFTPAMVASTESSTIVTAASSILDNENTSACLYKINTPFLTQEGCVFEKLNGTNFGIQCDGA
jgi:hypothetical protein